MKPKARSAETGQLFQQDLEHLLDQRNALYRLANRLPWLELESSLERHYSELGRPALPIRLLAGLLLLKQLENLSDERVCAAWEQNPYMQYFCGERYFQWKLPCEPSELVHFRKRIGQVGVDQILKMTLSLHADKIKEENDVVADTTVQEADVQFPTDTRLHVSCIKKLWRMGESESVRWRRRYTRTVPALLARLRTRSNRLVKDRKRCRRKVKTIVGRLQRDFERVVGAETLKLYQSELAVISRILNQKRSDKNKVYSLHDPNVLCIAKGKAHKKYEFGRKASIAMLRDSGVIVSAVSFEDNIYDGDTLEPTLAQGAELCGKTFDNAYVDRGYRGRRCVGETRVIIPGKADRRQSYYNQRKQRKRNGRRAAIEPVIGHLKSDHRLARCFLKGAAGAGLNLSLSAAAWNLKKWINETFFAVLWHLCSKQYARQVYGDVFNRNPRIAF
ncbi:MAG: IS5 family transposase [Verrucomicrobiota bacterium]